MDKTSIFYTCIILIILCTSPAFSDEKKIYTIGWDPWMPYQYLNANGKLVGLDIELIQTIFSEMGYALEYKKVPWKRLLPAIKRGKISLAAGASKSVDRMAYAYFSNAYRTESVVLFIRKGEKYAIKEISDIIAKNLMIGVISGFYYGQTFEKLMDNEDFRKHVQMTSKDTININKALNKRIYGFLCDKYAGIACINQAGHFNNFEIHPAAINSSDIHLMFSKKTCQPNVVKLFNETLIKLKKRGVINQIIHKYFQ